MKYKVLFVLIFVLGAVVRLFLLGNMPRGLTWDEAAIGYNAHSIATVHRDEWLFRMPISFRSFGDYKSPLLIYIISVILLFTPLTPLLVKLPVALSGIGTVVVTYFLVKELFTFYGKKKGTEIAALSSMLLVAVSPWAIHFSRIAFEATVATFLFSLGILLFLQSFKRQWLLPISIGFLLSTVYAYHSAKVVIPLAFILLGYTFRDKIRTFSVRWILCAVVIAIGSLSPLVVASIFGKANDRATSTTIFFTPEGKLQSPLHILTLFVRNYGAHLDPRYVLLGKEQTYRHGTKAYGIMHAVEFIFFLLGIFVILRYKEYRKLAFIPILFFISIIPPALGNDVPHANRALMGIPWLQMTAGVGFAWLFGTARTKKFIPLFLTLSAVGLIANCVVFYKTYTRTFQKTEALKEVGYGLEEAIQYARSQESSVDRVYFTNDYSQVYIYILFFKRMNPIDFRGGGLANYVLSENPYNDAKGHGRALVVGTRSDIPETIPPEKVIKYPDGSDAFVIVRQ